MPTFLLLLLPAEAARPVLAIDAVEADGCGRVRGTLVVRPRRRAREVAVTFDGADLALVQVPPRAASVPFEVPIGADRAGELGARWRYVDAAPVAVRTPPWDVALAVELPPEPPPAGEVPPLAIRALGPCAAPWTVDVVLVERDEPLAWRAPLVDGRATVPLRLPEGAWTLAVALRDGVGEVARREVRYPVGPPCLDLDGDGFPSCRAADCDDRDPRVHRGAVDVVGDGLDQDCDGRNGQDADGDGFEDRAAGGDDCDDRDARIHPGATGFPDPDGDGAVAFTDRDLDCDGAVEHAPGPFDCDESDPRIPREEAPVPTGVDEDCDGLVDEGTVAFDDDGDGLAEREGDCEDRDPRVRPGAPETADCRDEDCDGAIDEDLARPPVDDRWEPNDLEPVEIPGARWRAGFFGGRYRPSDARVRAVTRDLADVERYRVFAHDGDFDSFHVAVRVASLGDGRSYELLLVAPDGHVVSAIAERVGDAVSLGGRAGVDDSGDWRIEVRPLAGELDWCPLELDVSTG